MKAKPYTRTQRNTAWASFPLRITCSPKTAYIPCLLLYEEDIEVSFFFPTTRQSDVMQSLKTLYEQ